MLLAIDIGNTSINCGIFHKNILVTQKNIFTKKCNNSTFKNFIDGLIAKRKISESIICSVVPIKTFIIKNIIEKHYKITPKILKNSMFKKMKIKYNLKQIGLDRLVAIISATYKFGKPLIVLDFGTATTIDIIAKKGEILGGLIIPGIEMLKELLYQKTAQLPLIKLKKPKKIIGTNTQEAMQSGIIYGYINLINGLLEQIINELKYRPKIIATGGAIHLIKDEINIDITEPNLILEGLNLLNEKSYY